jgi:site-specific DNA recombinase
MFALESRVPSTDEPMRAVIYCRVSTKDQVKNLSLSTQQEACEEFCGRNCWQILQVFVEKGESAKTADRTELQRLLTFCRENRGRVQFVVVYSLNRFSRDKLAHHTLRALLAGFGVTLRSVTEPIDDSPTGKLVEGVIASVSQFDNDVRSQRSIAGMKARLERGGWTFAAPLGYRKAFDAIGNATLEPDPVVGPLVSKAFELFATGLHKQSDVRAKVTGLGLRTRTGKKLSSQSFGNMLKKPIYSGWLQVKAWDLRAKAAFKPLVPEDTFERVQALLAGKKTSLTPRTRNHPDFPLRRFVSCGHCGRPLTGSWSRGRHGGKYAYYRCPSSGCGSVNVRRERLESVLVELLEGLKPRPEVLRLFHSVVVDVWKQRQQNTAETRMLARRRLDELKHRKSRLVEAFVYKGAIDESTYQEERHNLDQQIALAELQHLEAHEDELDVQGALNFSEHVLSNAGRLWVESDLGGKQRLQQALFPQGVTFNNHQIATPVTSSIFYAIDDALAPKEEFGCPPGIRTPIC